VSLFLFAKLLQTIEISDEVLGYGDLISATVIIVMGLYLLFLVSTDRIQLKTHWHEGKEHTHIWFGKSHDHQESVAQSSSFTMGLLMGAGGVRGMLITLGAVGSGCVDLWMVGAFTAGVMLIFVGFGLVILYLNQHLLGSVKNVRYAFSVAGVVSLIVGTNILLG